MKKYRFAKFYLAGLLIAAILTLATGVVVGLYYGSDSVRAIIRSQSLSKEPVAVDTATVFNAFQEAAEILVANELVPSTATAIHYDREVRKGNSALLSLKEIDDFEAVIGQISRNVAQLRQQSIAKLRESVDQMLAASRAALPPQSIPLAKVPAVTHRSQRHLPLLFVDGAVTTSDVETLKLWSGFLDEKLQNYTQSASAKNLAVRANVNLQSLIVFLMKQLDLFRQSKEVIITAPTAKNEPVTPTERENRIREFMSILQRFEDSIEDVMAKEWVVDRELENAKKMAQAAKAGIHLRIAEEKQRAASSAIEMIRWIVGSLVASLLLLVARDFMSALIDTAANTAGILDKLVVVDSNKSDEV